MKGRFVFFFPWILVLLKTSLVAACTGGHTHDSYLLWFCEGQKGIIKTLPWDCKGFIHCDGTSVQWIGCAFGLEFDSKEQACIEESTTCEEQKEVAMEFCPEFHGLKFAHPKYCDMFYNCERGAENILHGFGIYEDKCPQGEVYNSLIMSCHKPTSESPVSCTHWQQSQETTHSMCDNTCTAHVQEMKGDVITLRNSLNSIEDKMNETRPDPYECSTPPTAENGILTMSYTPTGAKASYRCDDGYMICQGTKSECSNSNNWEGRGACVKYKWTEFVPLRQPIEYTCLPTDDVTVWVKGRYSGHPFGLKFYDQTGSTLRLAFDPHTMLLTIDFGKSQTSVKGKVHIGNEYSWILHFAKTVHISLNGILVSEEDHPFNTSTKPGKLGLTISGGFKPTSVEFKTGKPPSDKMKRGSSFNVAYKQPVSTTSVSASPGQVLTDGFTPTDTTQGSYWAPANSDEHPMVMVDLGQDFFIDSVVLTTVDCQDDTCAKYYPVAVKIHQSWSEDHTQFELCGGDTNPLPKGSSVRVTCADGTVGRFVEIYNSEDVDSSMTLMLSEIEVYGAHFEARGWTPYKCPPPPLMNNSTVHISYTGTEAVALYICNTTHGTCSGGNKIRCYSPRGWDEDPEPCVQTDFDGINRLPDLNVCPLQLGSGIELYVVPRLGDASIQLFDKEGVVVEMGIQPEDTAAPVKFGATDTLSSNPFVANRESKLTFTSLTDQILVEVDNVPVYEYNVDSEKVLDINALHINPDFEVRKAAIRRQVDGVVKADVMENDKLKNLALKKTYTASSSYSTPPDIAFDDDHGANYDDGGCWHAGVGDQRPWIEVDLQSLFYIKNIELSLMNLCPGCGAVSLTEENAAYGSNATDDDTLSPTYAVDGVITPDQCFNSTDNETWWMMDLTGSFLVKELLIRGHPDENLTDIEVNVYELNPETFPEAEPIFCGNYSGLLDVNHTLICDTPVRGRYVKITKLENATFSDMVLCEVDVYPVLGDRLHDFEIKVYERPPSSGDRGKVCYRHIGDLRVETGKMRCHEEPTGRYIRVEARRVDRADDLMTLCEMRVFGARAVKKPWEPYDCPNPPLMEKSTVVITHGEHQASAVYHCDHGYSHMCGSDVIYCKGPIGWSSLPSPCGKTLFSSNEKDGLESPVTLPCHLQLGQALKMAFTPTNIEALLDLLEETGTGSAIVKMKLLPDSASILAMSDKAPPSTYSADISTDTEADILLTFLTGNLDMEIDGVFIGQLPFSNLLDSIQTKGGKLRKVRVIPAKESLGLERALTANLVGPQHTIRASSTEDDGNVTRSIDGNLDRNADSKSCWIAADNDMDPYIVVDLQTYYFLERIVISTRSDCTDACGDRTHDIKIEVFYGDPLISRETPQLCRYREGVIPPDTEETITCDPVRGRWVRISGHKRRGPQDKLTICELQIYGGEVIRKPSTKSSIEHSPANHWLHEPCDENNACVSSQEGICNNGQCVCSPGKSFDYWESVCTTWCALYGEEFIEYPATSATFCDKTNITTATKEECKEACHSSTDFTCVVARYEEHTSTCILCDRSVAFAAEDDDNWVLYYRQCSQYTF